MKLVKSKLLTALALGLVLGSNANATDDDASNPCGALLCILGGQTSGECAKYYKYYIYTLPKSCKANPTCITKKQIEHLEKCDTKGNSEINSKIDSSLADTHGVTTFTQNIGTKINEMSGIQGECTKDELNRVEKKLLNNFTYNYRINPTQTKACQVLAGQTYSAIKVKYTCDRKWYSAEDWNNGFEKEIVSKAVYEGLNSNDRGTYITYKDAPSMDDLRYFKLTNAERAKYKVTQDKNKCDENGNCPNLYQEIITNYYKKNYVKKDCWEVEQAY